VTPLQDPGSPAPRWIGPLLGLSILLCLLAVAAVLQDGLRSSAPTAGTPVADILVNLGGVPVREHCTTCHPGGGAAGGDAGHPDIAPHRIEQLGCTGCHLGEGMALDEVLSHGVPGLGGRTLLSGRDVQGRCFSCHEPGPLEGARGAWRGARLFEAKACDGCHVADTASGGGRLGPDLSRIGDELGLARIAQAIADPSADLPDTRMPRYPLSDSQVRSLAYYLKSRVERPNHVTPMMLQARKGGPSGEVREVPPQQELLSQARCLACHRFGEEDGRIAPDLSHIGALRDRDYLADFLRSPASRIPGAHMPPARLPGSWEAPLTDFLARARGPLHHEDPKHLYMELCQRCHAANGDGRGLIHRNLADFPRPFADNTGYFRSRSDEAIRTRLRDGVPGTSMAGYGRLLGEAQREALLDLVFRSFVGIDRSDKRRPLPEPPPRPQALDPEGARSNYERLCRSCHGRGATGSGPEAPGMLPPPRNLTNGAYFAARSDEDIARALHAGVPGSRMEGFGQRLSAQELWSLVALVRAFSGRNP